MKYALRRNFMAGHEMLRHNFMAGHTQPLKKIILYIYFIYISDHNLTDPAHRSFKPQKERETMQVRTIQPHRLVEELQRAEMPKEAFPMAVLRSVVHPSLRRRRGIPHGVVNLIVRAEDVYIDPLCREVAFCHSGRYRAVDKVPKSDGLPYPSCDTVQTEMVCEVPKRGCYNVVMKVTVNGAVAVKILSATPAAECV